MTQSQVLIVQHVPWDEKPGRILDNLDDLNMYSPSTVVNIAKEKKPDLPDFAQVAGLVIMGGPMGALDYDKYPGSSRSRRNWSRRPSASASRCWACASAIRSSPPRWAANSACGGVAGNRVRADQAR